MENHIQSMAGHWLKIFICLVIMSSAQVYSQWNDMISMTYIENATAKGAVCLDGSPGAYHYAKGYGDGANNWIVFLPGGAWCGTKDDCISRSTYNLGSNKNVFPPYITFDGTIFSPNQTFNPDFYNWHRVSIRYCDGASFMANVEEVDPETNLHFRGARIFKATMEELLAKGMSNATNAILVGNSAGGLATILNCDRFQAFVPNVSRVKCIADSGFFIHAKDLPGVEKREEFYANVTAIHKLAKVLPPSCTSRMDPSLCLFPENVVGDVQTPLFILNSAFDRYQVSVHLKPHPADESGWKSCTNNTQNCTPAQSQIIKDFRTTFLETLNGVRDNPSRGWFINSCYIHDFIYRRPCWERTPKLENKTIGQAIGDWVFNRSIVRLIDTQNDYPVNCTTA